MLAFTRFRKISDFSFSKTDVGPRQILRPDVYNKATWRSYRVKGARARLYAVQELIGRFGLGERCRALLVERHARHPVLGGAAEIFRRPLGPGRMLYVVRHAGGCDAVVTGRRLPLRSSEVWPLHVGTALL